MSDSFHDESLRDVLLPPGLASRLRAIPTEELRQMSDDEMDAWLQSVVPPADLLARCRRVAAAPRRRVWSRQWAVAASLMFVVGLSYLTSMAAFLMSTSDAAVTRPPLFAEGEFFIEQEEATPLVELAGFALTPVMDAPMVPEPEPTLAAVVQAIEAVEDETDSAQDEFAADGVEPLALASADPGWQAVGNRFPKESFLDGPMNSGTPNPFAQAKPRPLGAEPPALPAFRLWQQATGFHPEVATATPELAVSRVPLDVDTGSFAAARQLVRQGALPRPEAVRVEDFLAAMDYGFTAPSGQPVVLRTAAGPSPFGGDQLQLLQVAVFAPPRKDTPQRPTWLTVLIDGSGSMQRDDRASYVRRALDCLFARLLPDDRISLVVYHRQAETLADYLTATESAAWISACQRWAPESTADLLAGMRAAYALAQAGPAGEERAAENVSRRVVLLSDGGPELDQNVARRLDSALSAAAREGMELDVIDLTEGGVPDRQLARCASAGGGRLHRALTSEKMLSGLLESLTGQPQTVATSAALTVTFDPAVVATWRLLGHEARPYQNDWLPASAPSELRVGQTSTALYELRLWPNERQVVAEARLRWHDPRAVASREATRTVRRAEFAATFAESAPALQAAALAAETAELLRHSYFAQDGSLRRVLEVAREASPALRETSAWKDWMGLVQDAQRIKPARTNSRRP